MPPFVSGYYRPLTLSKVNPGMSVLRDKTALVGIGATEYSKHSGRSVEALALEACHRAMAETGLAAADIDGIVTYGLADTVSTSVVATGLGVKRLRYAVDLNAGGNMAAGAVLQGAMAVATGQAHTVIVYRALNGSSGVRYGGRDFAERLELTSVHSDAEGQFMAPYGVLMPAHEFGLLCRRHMVEYGTTQEQLAAIAMTCRANANQNPRAQMRHKTMSLDDYLASPWVAEPFRVFDCCLMTDGACAVVITSADRAKDLRQKPVYLMAGGIGTGPANRGVMWSNFWADHTKCYANFMADDLFRQAGVGPRDMDVAELYDCFSYSVIAQLEGFGFCAPGEGGPFCEAGRIAIDGELPVNTHGGLLSEGYIHGLNGVYELVEQLRGESGSRQVPNAEIGIATAGGAGANGSAVILRH